MQLLTMLFFISCSPDKTDTANEVEYNGLVDNIDPDTPFNNIQVFGTHNSSTTSIPDSTTVRVELYP